MNKDINMIPLSHGVILSSILFFIGFLGAIIRRNLLFIFLGLEIMINASSLMFVIAGSYWHQADGQVMYIFILTAAAAEVSIGLAILLALHRCHNTLNIDGISEMNG